MTMENWERREVLLGALDTAQKARVLRKLESALAAADVDVVLSFEPHTETVNRRLWSTSIWTTLQPCSTTSLNRLAQSW